MSEEARELKSANARNYITHHPDSRTITVVVSGDTFPALFSTSLIEGPSDKGNVSHNRKSRHLTFHIESASLISTGDKVSVGDIVFTITRIDADASDETFQGVAWLV